MNPPRNRKDETGNPPPKGARASALPDNSESGGEESGTALALDEMYDEVRKGARLILEMEAAFVGTVENTTSSTLQNVRVEVHLSNGSAPG